MKKHVQYDVSYEVVSTLEYLKEEEPGQHCFSLRRTWVEGLWDSDEDEVMAYVEGGVVVGVEGYSGSIHPEEEIVVREMMAKILGQ